MVTEQRTGFLIHKDGDVRVQAQDAGRNLRSDGTVDGVIDGLRLFGAVCQQDDLLAFMMVPMPMVMACFGTSSIDWKKRALASMVFWVRSTTWVFSGNSSQGSLKAMWPLLPMPSSWMSTPPMLATTCSYRSHSACRSAAVPSGTLVFALSMLMWSNRLVRMK